MDLKLLSAPFPSEDVEWRIGRAGKTNDNIWASCLAYINNRAIMNRLDEVCGPENWKNEFSPGPAGGIVCGISIRIPQKLTKTGGVVHESYWVTKWDGAENTDIESVKGGLSDAMKRAAVQWGIGRYLYNLTEGWATIVDIKDKKAHSGSYKDKESGKTVWFRWDPPSLPHWALPEKETEEKMSKLASQS